MEPVLGLAGVHKSFGAVHALRGVDFDLHAGEVHALLGENGAGKSTLMNVLAGLLQADRGSIRLHGEERRFSGPREAAGAGIAMIHQELHLVGELGVAANIYLGRERRRSFGRLDEAAMRKGAAELIGRLGVSMDPDARVATLGVGQQQCVEILKALAADARILIMDEPSSALSRSEVDDLFELVRVLRGSGVAIVYISHRLDEVFRIADRITILRDGRKVLSAEASRLDEQSAVRAMVGEAGGKVPGTIPPKRRNRAWHLSAAFRRQAPGGAVLGVDALSLDAAEPGRPPLLEGLSFELGAGEILGLAGLLGSGRTELLSSLFGVFGKRVHGSITIAGSSTRIRDIRHAMELGLALIPEDRARLGLVPDRDLRDNLFLASSRQRLGVLRGAEERGVFERQATELRLKHADWRQGVLELSGGNQQKVLLGRWIQCEPRILLLDEPTRGIDVGARDEIYRWIERLAREGKAILIATSELPELCRLADRILVLRQGRLVREVASADTSQAELLGWMAGAGRDAG